MSRSISALLIAAALWGVGAPAAVAEPATIAPPWQIVESHGGVHHRPASTQQWWPARTGAEIPAGSIVATGSSGFLIIARAGDSITLRPNSRVELPSRPGDDQIRQAAGNLRYRISRAPDRRFTVETPYLSLLVKGTVFDVVVGDRGTEVQVTEGRVQVDSPGGQAALLTPGQSARIAAAADAPLEVRSAPERPFSITPPPGGSVAAADARGDGNSGTGRARPAAAHQAADRSDRASPGGGVGIEATAGGATSSPGRPVEGLTAGQSAPPAGSAAIGAVFGIAPESPLAPPPDRSIAAAYPHEDGSGGRDQPLPDTADRAADLSDRPAPDVGVGVEITAGGIGLDSPPRQVVELTLGDSAPPAGGVGTGAVFGPAPENPLAAPPSDRPTVAVATPDDGAPPADSRRRDTADQVSDRSDQASASASGSDDRVAMAVLVVVLAVALWWWWRSRQRITASGAGSGRWPWQRPPTGPSSATGPSVRAGSSTPVRDGTRR